MEAGNNAALITITEKMPSSTTLGNHPKERY